MNDLAALVAANEDAAAAIAAAYEILLGGVPNVAGFDFLINNAIDTNYGSNNPNVVFNQENIFINIVNSLVQGNSAAATAFSGLIAGQSTLIDKITALYNELVPNGTAEGIAFLTRPDALAFFEQVAAERGVAGPDGAAIVALASILNEAVKADLPGIGDSVNDLLAAIANGSAVLPETGNTLTPIEIADGDDFDGDDGFGKTISLTDRIDAPGIDDTQPGSGRNTMGTASDDTYLASDATLNPGDKIDGGAGRDTLILNLVDAGLTQADIGGAPFVPGLGLVVNRPLYEVESQSLEDVVVQLRGGNDILDNIINPPVPVPGQPLPVIISGAEIDLSRAVGVTDLSLERSAGLVKFSSIQNNVDINITDSIGWFTYVFDTGAVGAAATATLNVDNAYAIIDLETNGGDAFTSLVIDTTGFNVLSISDNFDTSLPLTSLTVTGAGTNVLVSGILSPILAGPLAGTLNEFANLTDIDMSGNTGGTFLELLFNEADVTYVGGSGPDIVLLDSAAGGGFLTNDDSFTGGAGFDMLGFGGDDLVTLAPGTVTGFEVFALFNDASGNDFKFENSGFGVDLALFADWNAELEVEDYDDNQVWIFGVLNNTTLAFDDTTDANITVGIPVELMPYVNLGLDFLDELGLDALIPLIANVPFNTFVNVVDLADSDVETLNFDIGGAGSLPLVDASLTVGTINLDGEVTTIDVDGSGDLILQALTLVTAADDADGLVFDLTELTGGFDNQGFGAQLADGPQTYLVGAIGNIEGSATFDFDGDAANDDSSFLAFGDVAGVADLFQDFAIFSDAGFGNVAITGFSGWNANPVLGQQDILDFTAMGVDELTDLTFTDIGGNVAITSSLFDGTVLLVGVTAGQLSNENFDFVA